MNSTRFVLFVFLVAGVISLPGQEPPTAAAGGRRSAPEGHVRGRLLLAHGTAVRHTRRRRFDHVGLLDPLGVQRRFLTCAFS